MSYLNKSLKAYRLSYLFLAGALLCSVLGLTGCDRPGSIVKSEAARDFISTNKDVDDEVSYGPVYTVGAIPDPLVARAVESLETTGAPVVGAEIRGFLVDWVVRRTNGASAREFAVMKDGSLYDRAGGPPLGGGPIAVHVSIPPRLDESLREARSRKAALAAAHQTVAEIYPTYKAAEPVVVSHLVRIYLKDGSSVDAWDDAHAGYDYKLQKVHN